MARTKKSEESRKDAATLQVSIEDFIRTRDSVVTGLATLQTAVQDLSRAYIAHTNTVLGHSSSAGAESLSGINFLTGVPAQPIPTPAIAPAGTPAPAAAEAGDGKKRKKRRPVDPNAPKRPLTPYFLFMQTARPDIRNDIGMDKKPKEISSEGTKRWHEMSEKEKEEWKSRYEINLAAYKEEVRKYKEAGGVVEDTELHADPEEDEEEPEPSPAPAKSKAKPKPAGTGETPKKRRKTEKDAPKPAVEAPTPKPAAAEPKKAASPEKEKKPRKSRKSKGAEEVKAPEPAPAPAPAPEEDKKEKKSKKKRKSEAASGA